MVPNQTLYTRQQLGQLAGLDDTTLNYWSRESLLVPSEGGQGRGSHRKFDFVQVNIAAILGQLRRFKLSLAVMRSFSDLLQKAAKLGQERPLHPGNYVDAAKLADRIERFRQGGEVMIYAHSTCEPRPAGLSTAEYTEWSIAKRPALSEEEVIARAIESVEHDTGEAIVAFARKIGPGRFVEAQIYAELVYDILAPGYSDMYSWLLGFGPNDSWRIEFGSEASFFNGLDGSSPEDFGPGIFLPVSGIIRQTWSLKKPWEYMRDRRADRIRELLEAVGIRATVTANNEHEEGYRIDAPDVEWSAIEAAIEPTVYGSLLPYMERTE